MNEGMGPSIWLAGDPADLKKWMNSGIEGIVTNLDENTEPLCPGEYGREALEIAIGLRESHRQGGEKIALPLADRTLKIG